MRSLCKDPIAMLLPATLLKSGFQPSVTIVTKYIRSVV